MKKTIAVLIFAFFAATSFAQTSSAERDSVAQTQPFQKKVKMATLKAANNLLADPGTDTRVRQYAQKVISEPQGTDWLTALSYGCMTNVAVNGNSSDGDIEFTVNSLFVKYAYAYYREAQP
jgi:hypothetical protein